MRYTGLDKPADFKGMKPGIGPAKEHQSNGVAHLLSYPTPKDPDSPVVVQFGCICGDGDCFFSVTAYDAMHIHYANDSERSPVYHSGESNHD